MTALLELISGSELSRLLRQSFWLYPLVNTGHIVGLGLLIGAVIPLDIRLLGGWPDVPVRSVARVLLPCASFGLVLTIGCGILLFVARPEDYVSSSLFVAKLCLVTAGLLNAIWLTARRTWKSALQSDSLSAAVKLHSFLSIVIWLAVVFIGRLIGYR
ncbi:MAG: hypothetical protein KDJ38_08680 [Gammaproteobacteria bacterium]|nr:hypothetical protein [Gammaproteobacteria bacterium]